MPYYGGSFGAGIGAGQEQGQRILQQQMALRQMQDAAVARQRALSARQQAGQVLYDMPMGGGQGIPPPPAGTPAGGPMPPGPGISSQPAGPPPGGVPGMLPPQMGGPQMPPPPGGAAPMPPPQIAMQGGMPGGGVQMTGQGGIPNLAQQAGRMATPPQPPIPPFKPMPTAPQPGAGPAPGIPAPPQAAAAPDAAPAAPQGQQFNLPALIKQLKSSGVPSDKVMDMLDELTPVMNAQNKQELEYFKANNQALKAANDLYVRLMGATTAGKNADTKAKDVESKVDTRAARVDLAQKDLDRKRQAAQAKVAEGTTEKLTPGGMKVAEELVRAGKSLPGGWGKSGQSRGNAILNEMAKNEEGGAGSGAVASGQAEFKAGEASLKQLTTRSNAIEQSSKKIDKDIVTLKKFLDSGTAGGVRLTNEPINKIREKFSSPELGQLMIAAQIVGTEYERMINGGLLSIAQLHEGAREDAKRLINADMTPTEMKARLGVMLQEIENQKSAFKEQIGEVRGGLGKRGAPAAAPAARQTATNPTTGEKVELVDGKWQPVKP